MLALAAALRIVGAGSGLPLPLLNPDETSIVPRAWELASRAGLDPGWYDYPSLLFLLVAPTQIGLDEPSYGTARVVAVALGLLGVAAAWWLGRVAVGALAGIAAAVVVAVATTHVAYSRMAVTDVLLTLGVTVCLALLVTDRLEWAGVAAGLAASAKYPGALLLVPLLVAGWGRWRRVAVSAGLALAGFALTSPFVLVHADGRGTTSVACSRSHGTAGSASRTTRSRRSPTRSASGTRSVRSPSWRWRGSASPSGGTARSDLILLSFAAVYGASLLTSSAHFDRYVLPLVPVVAVLAARTPPLAVATLVAALVPLWWSIDDARSLTGRDPRLDAAAWIDRTIPRDERIAADSSTLPLRGRDVLRLELPGPGRAFDPDRDLERLRARGIRWLVLGGSVADRVLAAAEDYPREAAFYRAAARLRPAYATPDDDGRRSRPWLRVYRIYP